MAMRAIWRGSIGFGLVNIPVRMFSAVQESELDLDMLDAHDHARIRFQRVNETSGEEVPWENIVRAYKHKGKYVVLDDDDLNRAASQKTGLIAIRNFIKEEEVAAKYYERPYYLEPEKSGTHAYALLREALKKKGKVGVASFVMRTKEHPAIVAVDGSALLLIQMRFAEEIRDVTDLALPDKPKFSAQELKLAMALIEQGTGAFDITHYKDTYRQELMKMIRAKAKGEKPKAVAKKKTSTKRVDLMSQLKASLKASARYDA